MNRIEEIEARMSAIASELESDGADIDALTAEVRSLKAEKQAIEEGIRKRAELRSNVSAGAGTVVRTFSQQPEERTFGVDSKEYRAAWLKNLQGVTLSDAEMRAYTNENGAISSIVANNIMTVVRDHAPLLERMTVVYSPANISYYVEGTNNAAADHTENAAITAAADTLTKISLVPAEIVKLIQISDAAKVMSVDAFDAWLSRTLGEAIARKINSKIITAIGTAAASAGTTITAATVQTLLGSVKGDGLAIICNRKTLYTGLLPLQDNSKNSLVRFEGAAATMYGVDVLVDDNVADSTVLAGDLTKAIAAMAESVTVRQAYDIDTNSYKYIGVALFDTKIGLSAAFGKLAPAAG